MSKIRKISTPYAGTDRKTYYSEKRRLQLELLNIQNRVIEQKKRVAIIFEGRDAAGKGSTIKTITENLMSRHIRAVELGVPTKKESKYWFRRYENKLPKPG